MVKKFNQGAVKFLFWTTAFSTMMFFLVVIISVMTRYLTKSPISGSIELSRLFFVWSCFLAAALAYYRKSHISITFIVDFFPVKLKALALSFVYILVMVFSGAVFYYGINVIIFLWYTELPMLEISQSWFYIPLPLMAVNIIFFTIELFYEDVLVPLKI